MRILLLAGIVAMCAPPAVPAAKDEVEIPPEILARIPKDLDLKSTDLECIRGAGGIGTVVAAKAMNIAPNVRSLVIGSTFGCLAGIYNAPLLLYAQWPGGGWQLLINGYGETAEAVDSKGGPLKDVVFSTDESGGWTTRIRYSFMGRRYRPASCDAWEWKERMHCGSHWKSHYPAAATFAARF